MGKMRKRVQLPLQKRQMQRIADGWGWWPVGPHVKRGRLERPHAARAVWCGAALRTFRVVLRRSSAPAATSKASPGETTTPVVVMCHAVSGARSSYRTRSASEALKAWVHGRVGSAGGGGGGGAVSVAEGAGGGLHMPWMPFSTSTCILRQRPWQSHNIHRCHQNHA